MKNRVYIWHRKKLLILFVVIVTALMAVCVQLVYVMVIRSDYYNERAQLLHERERRIKAARGNIYDRNGVLLATNKTVCTVSLVHSQITEPEKVISMLVSELEIDEKEARKRTERNVAVEVVKTNVDKQKGDIIRGYNLDGVKVDEDYKRVYPFGTLASKVIGFTGADNQGIIGLEAKYEKNLMGVNGNILTLTDAWGIELGNTGEARSEPTDGDDLYITIDYNIQKYAQQLAEKTLIAKEAKNVSIIVMKPDDGEILAMTNAPEFDLNSPYTLNCEQTSEKYTDQLNKMWRNYCINDTYEPGSVFKMVTATAALETGAVSLNDSFSCGGSCQVGGWTIRCHKRTGHGTQSFTETVMNSCNPAFISWGLRTGKENLYKYMTKLGLMDKTGIDLAGEGTTICHSLENIGDVELATMSFGQSFQITPVQMLRAAAAIVNGGNLVTPHFGIKTVNSEGSAAVEFAYETVNDVIDDKTSENMSQILEAVVSEGGGINAYIEGYSIGGKTATSQKLPRSAAKYIASFIGFCPVDKPEVIAMCLINEPSGVYYGGTIAAPVIRELFENILPYLEISKQEE